MRITIYLKSGQVIQVKLKQFSMSSGTVRWTNLEGGHEKLLTVDPDEIAAVTYKGK